MNRLASALRRLTAGFFGLALLAVSPAWAAPGDLDPGFGTNGKLVLPFGPGTEDDYGDAVAVQANGRIVVTGSTRVGGGPNVAVTRLLADGQLDPEFGTGGKVSLPIPGSTGYAVRIQPDQKIVIAGETEAGANNFDFLVIRLLPDGTPDPEFGTQGVVTTEFGGNDSGKALALSSGSDGTIVVAGVSDGKFAAARYLSNGAVDSGFGDGGKVTVTGLQAVDFMGTAIQGDGKVVVAGTSYSEGNPCFATLRFLTNGDPDPQFGDGGQVLTRHSDIFVQVGGVVIQDNKIVVAGTDFAADGVAVVLTRYLEDGSLDPAFGTGGIVSTVKPGAFLVGFAVALQPDQKLVVSGYTGDGDTFLVRYSKDGPLDYDFGTNGLTFTDFGGGDEYATAVTVDNDGNIVVAGYTNANRIPMSPVTNYDFVVARFEGGPYDTVTQTPTDLQVTSVEFQGRSLNVSFTLPEAAQSGSVKLTFTPAGGGTAQSYTLASDYETAGPHLFGFNPDNPSASASIVIADGALLDGTYSVTVSYRDKFGNAAATSTAVTGVTIASTPVPGSLTTLDANIVGPPNASVVYATAVQPDGKILIGGAFTSVQGESRRHFARLNADGSIDTAFDVTTEGSIYDGAGFVTCVAVQPDGKILVGGDFTAIKPHGAAQSTPRHGFARLNADGTLDSTFDPHPNSPVYAIAIQPDGKIVIGGNFSTLQPAGAGSPTLRFCAARLNPNGSIDPDFDPHISGENPAIVTSIALPPGGKVLIGGYFDSLQPHADGPTFTRHHLARLNADGSVDPDFADYHIAGYVGAVALQADGKILVGGDFSGIQDPGAANPSLREKLARINADGSLDLLYNPNPNSEVYSIAVLTNGKVLIGGRFVMVGLGNNITPANYLACLGADGRPDPDFLDVNADSSVRSVAVQPDGQVLIGGAFSSLAPGNISSPTTRNLFARLENRPGSQILTVVDATKIQWQRTGAGPESSAVSFERSLDNGTAWKSLGAGTRISGGWEIAGQNLAGLRGLVRARARVASGWNNGSAGIVDQTTTFDFDTAGGVTLTPALAAPASGSATIDPVVVTFTLPEPAKAGSVELRFVTTDNAVSRTLTLATSQESADTHTFSFNSKNPATGGQSRIASITGGNDVPDGLYNVTLAYRDTLDHTEATAVSTNVRIDTTPPSISAPVGGFAPLIVVTGTPLPNYAADLVRTDVSGIASVAQTPPATTTILTANTSVYLTATDTLGNTSDPLEIKVVVRPQNPGHTVAFGKGSDAPGAGTNELPSGAKLATFNTPAIDGQGNLAFVAKWTTADGKTKGTGLFLSDKCLAVVGGSASAIAPNAKWKSFSDPVVENGKVVCIAKLSTGASAVVSNFSGSALEKIAITGEAAADEGDAKFKGFKTVALRGGSLGFLAQMAGGTGVNKVTPARDMGLWVQEPGAALHRVYRDGFDLGGERIVGSFVSFQPGVGSPGQGRGWLTHNQQGLVLTLNTFTDKAKTKALVFGGFGGDTFLALTGEKNNNFAPALTDASFASFRFPALNDSLENTFYATMKVGAGGVTKADAGGIFASGAEFGGSLAPYALLAQVNHDAGTTGAKFAQLKDPVLSEDGDIAFQATLKGGTAKGFAAQTIWWKPADQPLALLAQGGANAGGALNDLPTGAQWKTFPSLAIADGRGAIFTATLVVGKGGVKATDATGVWAMDFTGKLRTLFRTGATIGGKTVKSFLVLNTQVGSTGVTRHFNDAQQVVWLATFKEDKSQAIVVTEVP